MCWQFNALEGCIRAIWEQEPSFLSNAHMFDLTDIDGENYGTSDAVVLFLESD